MTINIPKRNLKWLYNPYFLVFGRNQSNEETQDLPTINIFSYDLKGPILYTEDKLYNTSKYQILQKKIYPFFEYSLKIIYGNKPPILTITFILSVAIAANKALRLKFYESFSGKIPAFTQFLLNSIWIGPLDSEQYLILKDCELDINGENTVSQEGLEGIFSIYFWDNDQNNHDTFNEIIQWFEWLEEFCADDHHLFHFVPLTKTPMQSNHGNEKSLLAFNQAILNFWIDPSINSNPKLKENYYLLNEVLRTQLVGLETYNYEMEHENFKTDSSTFLNNGRCSEEYKLAEKLFYFMTHCNENDLV